MNKNQYQVVVLVESSNASYYRNPQNGLLSTIQDEVFTQPCEKYLVDKSASIRDGDVVYVPELNSVERVNYLSHRYVGDTCYIKRGGYMFACEKVILTTRELVEI